MQLVVLDAHLSPGLAAMLNRAFPEYEFKSLNAVNLRHSKDPDIFSAIRNLAAVLLTKDKDFIRLHGLRGSPPFILYITGDNRRTLRMFEFLQPRLRAALAEVVRDGLVII